MAKFSLATNEHYKGKDGEWQDRTEWHNLVAWRRTAEIIGDYVKKGSRIYVEGSLRTSSWEDNRTGEKKQRTEIIVNEFVLLGGSGNGKDTFRPAAETFGQRASELESAGAHSTIITDEDIPF